MGLLARGSLALFAGYLVAAMWSIVLARIFPMTRIDATITATMVSFAVYAGCAVWAFASRTAWVAAFGLALMAALGAVIAWLI